MAATSSITIITPFYNQNTIFWETYQSVLDQTFRDWNWIVVDDGSDQPISLEILQTLSSGDDPRIRIVTLPGNQGLPAARNAGVKAATAPFIFFLDSDDLIQNDYLEKARIALILNPDFSFVNSWSTGFGALTYDWKVGLEKGKGFLDQNWVAFAGLFRKEVLLNIPFNEEKSEGLEDWEFWLSAAAKGYWGYTMPERLFHYRIHDKSRKKWKNWDNGKKQWRIKRQLQQTYRPAFASGFPHPKKKVYGAADTAPVIDNAALDERSSGRPLVLIALPWLGGGGVEKFTFDSMKALNDDMDFIVVTTNASADNDLGPFKEVSREQFHLSALANPTAYPYLLDYLLSSRQPDAIVLSNTQPFYHLLPYIRARFPAIPVIDINHMDDKHWLNGGYPAMAAGFTEYITRHIVISEWLRTFMTGRGVGTDKITTVYVSADTRQLLPPNDNTKRDEPPVLLFTGRLTHQKNTLLLPEIAAALAARQLSFRITVCGDGPDKAQLQESIYKKKLTQYFDLRGAVPHPGILAAMQTATLLLLPSAWEGIATVLYEAMASGLPVVTTDVGGQKELVTPDTGILINAANNTDLVQQTAAAIEDLLQHPAKRQQLAHAARERVAAHFDRTTAFASLRSVLQSAIDQSMRPSIDQPTRPSMDRSAAPSIHQSMPGQASQSRTGQASQPGPTQPNTDQTAALNNYLSFAAGWNILQSEKPVAAWKHSRPIRALRKIYKIASGKRPLSYLWKQA